MSRIDKLVRENVLKLTPYSCARDEYQGSSGIFLDANENPYGSLNRYPDPYQKKLKSTIASFRGIPIGNIFLGNGSDEIIDLVFRVFCKPGSDSVLTFTPTYGMYEVSASVNDIRVHRIPLKSDFQIDMDAASALLNDSSLKLIFVCSPNNPTGNAMNFSDVENLLSRFKGVVVIDEAYIDFSEKPSFTSLLGKHDNLIVMQTFSKALGLAAARIGIAFTSPEIITYLNKIKPPYNMSTINQKAALRKLEDLPGYTRQLALIKKERENLAEAIRCLPLTEEVYPSDANFLLVRVKDANYLYKALTEKGIVVRNRHSVVSNCLRITVGKPEENRKLIKALQSLQI